MGKRITKQGRKASDGAEGLKRYNVMLDDITVTKAVEEGSGSLSLGIRRKFRDEKKEAK